MYEKLGTFEPATAAKLSARLGLYFTSSWKTRLQLKRSNVALIEDITSETTDSAGNCYCFTDGNGIMSYLFAKQISTQLELPYVPSAFQIRFAGYKGMLTVAPKDSKNIENPYYTHLIDNNGKYFALFRKSQKKFHVEGDDLLDFDIVQWSAPGPFNLYRTFIAILNYQAYKNDKQPIVQNRFRELNNSACYNIIDPLINNKGFRQKLEELPTYCPFSKMENKNLMFEPFWRSMVEASVLADAKMLASKTQLPLPANLGRTAFGIADHTRKLKEHQVFFQCSQTLSTKSCNKAPILITGRVGITRSPIFHPGDIRFYEAVDIPELRYLVDVLVFPTVGDRPIPDQIGGGDLDGDPYGVFWDEALIIDKNAVASDFAEHNSHKAEKITINELPEKHPEFRAEYQKNRNIEPLSTSYLAILLTQDPNSVECRSLRECADSAVNYPKSGIFGRPLKDEERHIFWPAFMGKNHEPSFKSSHILCELHEQSNEWYQQIRGATKEAQKRRSEKVITSKTNTYRIVHQYFCDFKREIQKIMVKHQIQTEGELYSNSFDNICGALNNVKLPLINESSDTSIVQKQVHHIFKNYRSKFLNLFSENWKEDMEAKKDNIFTYKFTPVSPKMIEVAKHMYLLAEEDKTCNAFPWLLWEGLDAWSEDQSRKHWESAAEKIDTDFKKQPPTDLLFQTLPGLSPLKSVLSRRGVDLSWLATFSQMCNMWLASVKLDSEIYSSMFQKIVIGVLTAMVKEEIPDTETSGKVFLTFLISKMQEINNKTLVNEFSELHGAIQTTLIKLAFLPKTNLFEDAEFEQIVEQQCIVISVPKNWAPEFDEKYGILKEKSGCDNVAIGVRRSFRDAIYYSVMFRGTKEACQKLKTMVTPVITLTLQHSMKDTKKHISDTMNKLLMEIFDFEQPLNQSSSTPNRLNSGNNNRRRNRHRNRRV